MAHIYFQKKLPNIQYFHEEVINNFMGNDNFQQKKTSSKRNISQEKQLLRRSIISKEKDTIYKGNALSKYFVIHCVCAFE